MIGWVPVVAGVGSAVAGGFYVAFSAVVMPALRRRAPADAAATMVAINENAERAPFMTVFFGAAVASAATIATAVVDPQPASPLRIVGATLYLAGVVSTIAANVPLNRRLAAAGENRAAQWPGFVRPWTRLNTVRAVLSIAGAVALLVRMP
ncbi:anthrone oxygenase family protein [Mycetocola sp.]|uniref:anthrone oxygenase family protein n=1 Tax=Mycetocola sp. TaxID=1871042 RepID=UPI00398A1A48